MSAEHWLPTDDAIPAEYYPYTKGWHRESVWDVVNKLTFSDLRGKEAALFAEGVVSGVCGGAQEIKVANLPADYHAMGVLKGSTAANWVHANPEGLQLPSRFRSTMNQTTLPRDPFYRKSLEKLTHGPFNMDLQVICEPGEKRLTMLESIHENVTANLNFASHGLIAQEGEKRTWDYQSLKFGRIKAESTRLHHKNGVEVLVYTLCDVIGNQIYSVDVTTYPTEEEMANDYRSGLHNSTKQNMESFIAMDTWGDMSDAFLVLDTEEKYKGKQELLKAKTRIVNPSYQNIDQALIAGMRAVRLELLHPAEDSTGKPLKGKARFETETIQKYKLELLELLRVYKEGDYTPNPYRVEEIIREAAVCMALDREFTLEMFSALGVSEVFFADILDKPIPMTMRSFMDHSETKLGPLEFARLLKQSGKIFDESTDWGVFAEAFDIRNVKDRNRQPLRKFYPRQMGDL